MSSEKQSGIGFCGLLTIVFITLKLTGFIAWPLMWVLAPLWVPFAIFFGVIAITAIIALLVGMCSLLTAEYQRKRQEAKRKLAKV